ncbi:MAG: aldo/keto reductase [Kofleriaceae bacterium]
MIPKLKLPAGDAIPVLGQGTWRMGEDPRRRDDEILALRTGLDFGLSLIDTAEMYGDGSTERLVADAIAGRRDEVFLVSKVLPSHATRSAVVAACEGSLRRLRTDRLDLYLLHWRGETPLDETLAGFEDLIAAGKIRSWGVSNFDVPDLEELIALSGGRAVQVDQVLYNLGRRGIEWDLVPWCRQARTPIMAYSPIEQGRLLGVPALERVARRHGATPAQVALAWTIRLDDVCAIPKAGTAAHVRENLGALEIQLSRHDLAELDEAFPPPTESRTLEVL